MRPRHRALGRQDPDRVARIGDPRPDPVVVLDNGGCPHVRAVARRVAIGEHRRSKFPCRRAAHRRVDAELRRVATDGEPFDPPPVQQLLQARSAEGIARGLVDDLVAGLRPERIREQPSGRVSIPWRSGRLVAYENHRPARAARPPRGCRQDGSHLVRAMTRRLSEKYGLLIVDDEQGIHGGGLGHAPRWTAIGQARAP